MNINNLKRQKAVIESESKPDALQKKTEDALTLGGLDQAQRVNPIEDKRKENEPTQVSAVNEGVREFVIDGDKGQERAEAGPVNEELTTLKSNPKIPEKLTALWNVDKKLCQLHMSKREVLLTTSLRVDQERSNLLKDYGVIVGLNSQDLTALAIDYFIEKFDDKFEEIRKLKKKRDF